ncbi:YdcF family protein [Bacillus sp. SCS-153A]|uniref:YdcF family protein n=1 Tax=Rossellomorea sedimentorum TaxID=3115294 RepID=UPI0039068CB7
MKPIISKEPEVPNLTVRKIKDLTEIVFGEEKEVIQCEALFLFSGTHPGHWETAAEAYHRGLCRKIIVTGGKSLTGIPHPDWPDKSAKEAEVIISHLLKAGIPKETIVYEDRSTNSLENVLYAKEIFDFSSIHKLIYICKSHASGRQERTLRKHLGDRLDYIPFPFDAEYQGVKVNRNTWSQTETGRTRVWGEFLRILAYGEKGDIVPL